MDGAISFKKRFRFRNNQGLNTSFNITDTDLFELVAVAITIVPITAVPIYSAFRLRSVSLWYATDPTTGISLPVKISPTIGSAGNTGTRPTVYMDTSTGTAIPAKVIWKPIPNTASSSWQIRPTGVSTGGAFFNIYAPKNAVIDIVMDVMLQNGQTPQVFTPPAGVLVTAIGQLFYNFLDSNTSSSLVPEDFTI